MKKLILAAATAGVLALFSGVSPAQAQATSSDQVLFGITFFKNELIRIDTTTGEGKIVKSSGMDEMAYGLTTYAAALYTFSPITNTIDELSKIDGRVTRRIPIGVTGLQGEGDVVIGSNGVGYLASAFDPKGAPTHPLYSFDVNAGTSVLLGNTRVALDGLALDQSKTPSTLYALGQGDSGMMDPANAETELYTVNVATGALTPVGPIGVPQNSPIAGMTFSPDGTLYASIDDRLYTIDTATGSATIVDAATPDFSYNSVSGLAFAMGESTLGNLSSRARVVGGGDDVLITGFIITPEQPGGPPVPPGVDKTVVIRGLGPSLSIAGKALPGTLANPTLTLYDADGNELQTNDNWKQNSEADRLTITENNLAPSDFRESVIVASLPQGQYTAILKGKLNGTGLALEEIYDISEGNGLKQGNLSARAMVTPGDGALISGMIVEGAVTKHVLIRGLGPSLKVPDPLKNPKLTLYNANGVVLESNDNWMNSPDAAAIMSSGLAPMNRKESAIDRIFSPGQFSVVLTGVGNDQSGTALLEVFDRSNSAAITPR